MIFFIGILLGIVSVIFAFQNTAVVSVAFLGWQLEGSLAFIILLALVAGMLIFALLTLPAAIKDNMLFSRMARHNRRLAKDLEVHKEKLVEAEVKLEEKPAVIEKTTVIERPPQA